MKPIRLSDYGILPNTDITSSLRVLMEQYKENVEFIFENCEVFRISGEDIGELYLDDINHHYRRITADFVERFEYVNTFFIEIHKRANEPYECFGGPDTMYKFDRILHYDDITLIKMKINGEEKTFYLKWDNPYKEEKSLICPNEEQCPICKNRHEYTDLETIVFGESFYKIQNICVGVDGCEYPEPITYIDVEKEKNCPYFEVNEE